MLNGPGDRGRRITFRDRTWLRFSTVRAAGPLRAPTAETIRSQLVRLHHREPNHPLLCRVDHRRGRLHPTRNIEQLLSEVVVSAERQDAHQLSRSLLESDLGDLPFRLALSDRAAAMHSAHVIGDGAVANRWFINLLSGSPLDTHGARADRKLAPRLPLLRAVLHQFVGHPRNALRAARGSLPLGPVRGGALHELAVGLPELVVATVPNSRLDELRRWRDEQTPRTSLAATVMAATMRSLRDSGLVHSDGVFVMMDCRRYLPGGSGTTANFATGPYLTPTDAADAQSLGAAVNAAARDGVPLVLLTALTLRNVLRRRPLALDHRVSSPPQPRVTLSYQGRLELDKLPWLDGEAQSYLIAGQPAGAEGVTICFATGPTGLHLTLTAHPEVVDTAVAREALADLCSGLTVAVSTTEDR